MMVNILTHIKLLRKFVESHHFAGYDPYDALNSSLIRTLCFGTKLGRMGWIQFLRRFPVNLRSLLGVPKGHNPKGLGLFLRGYAKLYKIDSQPDHLGKIDFLLNLLAASRSRGYSGNCWGYNFDWQSQAFFIPKYTPTIVNSSFIGHALLDAWEITGNQKALDMAVSIKDFILKDLHRSQFGNYFCFSYTPIDQTMVHNANMLGASLLIRLYKIIGENELRNAALLSLGYSMKFQNNDGSWIYGQRKTQNWIDSFHTGFNLEAIRYFLRLGEAGEFTDQYKKGVLFYARNFFLKDGTPKYYHNSVYPIDIHSPAEAVAFFSGEGNRFEKLTEKVLNWMLLNMRSPEGFFYFRKEKYFTNKIPYMRWSQAWVFHALTEYLFHYKKKFNL